jgi:hypothetical protein
MARLQVFHVNIGGGELVLRPGFWQSPVTVPATGYA